MKIELEKLAPYLPYKLQIQSTLGIKEMHYNRFENRNDLVMVLDVLKATFNEKPILRPLSDLTKEIEVNGESFVPAVRLHFGNDAIEILQGDNWVSQWLSYEECNYLISWHFDVFGLIEQGLAVDINTLSE
jgi:hypothetical protein